MHEKFAQRRQVREKEKELRSLKWFHYSLRKSHISLRLGFLNCEITGPIHRVTMDKANWCLDNVWHTVHNK